VKQFQKRSGLKDDGIVGPKTAAAIAKLAGHGAAPTAAGNGGGKPAAGPGGAAAAEPRHVITVNNKTYTFTKKEFDSFNNEMVALLKRTAVLGAQQRVDAARVCWDSFYAYNNQQKVVSWFVGIMGPKLPSESIVKSGEQAYEALKSAVSGGNFKQIQDQLSKSSAPINTAYKTMISYRKEVIGRAENELVALEFVRDKSFEIVTAIAELELKAVPGGNAIAGGGSELVKSCANELGKYMAGTSGGGADAIKSIVVDGVLGAATGAAGDLLNSKRGEEIIEGVAKSTVKKLMTNKWAARIGTEKVKKLVTRGLNGAMKGALDAGVKNASKMIKGDMTPDQFFEEIAKGAGFGTFLEGLDEWIEKKDFATIIFEKSSLSRIDLGKVSKADAIKKLQELLQGNAKEGIKSSIEFVIDKAKGNEKTEDVGQDIAEQFARVYAKNLEAEFTKRIQKK
jgi:hypothetical protein